VKVRRAMTILLSFVVVVAAAAAGSAKGAELVVHELPDATHALPFGVSPDGSIWGVVSHGTQRESSGFYALGRLAPDGTLAEISSPIVERPTLSPSGEVWAVEGQGYPVHEGPLTIVRLTSAGDIAATYPVGQVKGSIYSEITGPVGVSAMVATDEALWFARGRGVTARSSIERLSTGDGTISQHFLPPGYQPTALAVTPGGTAWFIETDSGRTFITRLRPDKEVRKWQLKNEPVTPVSLAIGKSGAVWFGVSSEYGSGYPTQFGRITRRGKLLLFSAPRADPDSIAVGPEGRLWFQQAIGRPYYSRALNSIGIDGRTGKPVCAAPGCQLQVGGLVGAPDGSLWYGLRQPNLNTGGGGSGLGIEMEIENEAGFVGHFSR
jgi:hypothetical protein